MTSWGSSRARGSSKDWPSVAPGVLARRYCFGRKTLDAGGRTVRHVRTLRRGDRGREVVDLQTRLQALGFDLGSRGVDGVFRESTELVVRSFQQRLGLLADGLVGPITWREIVEAGYRPGGRLLYLRQPLFRGADVVELQQMLDVLGFDPGAVNGLFDFRTVRAVRDFQKNAGLQDDGVVDA